MTKTYSVLAPLGAIQGHLERHELPEPVSVSVSMLGRSVVVQLQEVGLARLADALLAWAASLADVSVEAWRVPGGYNVHLTVHGRLPAGTPVQVYDAVEFDPVTFPDLPADAHQAVELAVLHVWALPGREVAA